MAQRVIFSDLHFGDRACSLSNKSVTEGLRAFLWGLPAVKELILAGDILDANISSLTRAIEGKQNSGTWPAQLGFRQWLRHLFEGDKFSVERIVYIPGNHDYIIWNILSTNKVFVDPISQGVVPGQLPLMEATFPHPFIAGVAPAGIRDRFIVTYPDYEFDLGGRSVLVTHGHYLDEKQTLLKNLDALIRKENGNKKEAIRKFFIGTAQYQAVANAVSYLKGSRDLVERFYKGISSCFDLIGKLRDKKVDANTLRAIELYLYYFRDKQPDVFIFGHTHTAVHTNTNVLKATRLIGKSIEVWNDGSFLSSSGGGPSGTFLVADDSAAPAGAINAFEVNSKGRVTKKNI